MLANQLTNIIDNTIRFRWTHGTIVKALGDYYGTDLYKKVPRWAHCYLRGILDARMSEIWRKEVVFSYEIDGKRLSIEDPKYREVPAQYVHENFSHTGAFIWRGDHAKYWTAPGDGQKRDIAINP